MSRLINPMGINVYLLLLIKHLSLFWSFLFLTSIFVTKTFLGLEFFFILSQKFSLKLELI